MAEQTPTPVPASSNLIGQTLRGTYRVLGVLDRGGMGTVYLGEHLRLRRRVALKVLADHLALQDHALQRFRREAEIIAQLQHPNIVSVLDFDMTNEGQLYLAMELLEGESLDARLEREVRLPLVDVVRIVSQAASGLAAAHAKNIVHRDLKPGNIYLAKIPDGFLVKLLDFGISKGLDMIPMGITAEFAVLGTPEYMAPEQAAGRTARVDHLGDQFSLAVVAYEMLSGLTPFLAGSADEILENVIHSEPEPLTRRAPDVPTELDPVLSRALSKLPSARFPNIQEFAAAFVTASGLSVPPVPEPHLQRRDARLSPTSQIYEDVLQSLASTPVSPDVASPQPAPVRPASDRPLGAGAGVRAAAPKPASDPPSPKPIRSKPGTVKLDSDPARRFGQAQGLAQPKPVSVPPSDAISSGRARNSMPVNPSSRARIQTSPAKQFALNVAEARQAFALGDLDLAVNYAESALRVADVCPSPEMDEAVRTSAQLFERIFRSRLGGPGRRVHLQPAVRPVRRSDPSPAQLVLLEHLVNGVPWEDNLRATPLGEQESLRALVGLVLRGSVRLE